MKPILICPRCGSPCFDVHYKSIRNFIKDFKQTSSKWGLCSNPSCKNIYISSSSEIYTKEDLVKPIWFKLSGGDVPICYCSNLSRKEIALAVKAGCKSIRDVQNYTNKNITGKCETENPVERCCKYAFEYAIKSALLDDDK